MDKKILNILVCPNCHSKILFKGNFFICSKCKEKFFSQDEIFSFLPKNFKTEEDFKFKEAQIKFFEEWSDRKRTNCKFKKNGFESFFFSDGKGSRINYSRSQIEKTIAQLPSGAVVLELGCGAGEHTAFMAKLREDIHLIAIDISPKSVLETRERIKADKKVKCKMTFLVADAEALLFKDRSIDSIMAVMFYHHVANPRKSVREIKRIMSPNGFALIVDMISNNPLNTLPRKIFPYFPISIKKRLSNDYLLKNCDIPLVSLHSSSEIKRIIKQSKLKVISENRYDLFVFFIYHLAIIFPIIKIIFPRSLLEKIYHFENNLLKMKVFNNFAAVVSLCISQN